MSFGLVLVIAIPILFVIGTTYNAIKEQKKLEDGILKNVLKKREEMKKINLKKQQKQSNNSHYNICNLLRKLILTITLNIYKGH